MYKYSFSTAALFPRDSAEALRLIGEAGFEYAELMPQCFSDVEEPFVARAEKSGVRVGSVHYPLAMFSMLYNAHPGMCADARAFGKKLVRLCSLLGTSVLVIHPHETVSDPATRELLEAPIRDNIVDLAANCERAGVQLVVENNPKGPGRTPKGLLDYLESFRDLGRFEPMVDTTEAIEAGEDPAEFIREVGPSHLHLSDHRGEKKHLPAGEGEIEWRKVREALDGYGGFYTLEPLYRYYLDDPKPKLKKARAFIGGLVEGGHDA